MTEKPSYFSDNVGRHLFVPEIYRFDERAKLLDYLFHNPFAQLFSGTEEGLQASATPLILDPEPEQEATAGELVFLGHVAARNPQCRAIEQGAPALAVVTGADAYISPAWFLEANTVPTWSFIAVHLRGRFEPVSDSQESMRILGKTIDHMEQRLGLSGQPKPWSLELAPPQRVEMLCEHILAFRLIVHTLEGVRRLNQDKSETDRRSIIAGLRGSAQQGAAEVARLMSEQLEPNIRQGG